MPSSTGVRGGVQAIPVVGAPAARDVGATALERSLTALPEATIQSGELQERTEEVQAHAAALQERKQKAQDVLDAAQTDQLFAQQYQTKIAELQKGDYRTFAKSVVEAGNDLLAQAADAKNLTPKAKEYFTLKAQERITGAQQHALNYEVKRMDNESTFTLANAMYTAQHDWANAANPYDKQVAWGRFEETLNQFAQSGLKDGGALADMRQKTLDTLHLQDVRTATELDPGAMKRQLTNQAQGKETDPNLPLAPGEHLGDLLKEAAAVEQQQFGQRENRERLAEHYLGKQQEQNAADVFARMSIITTTRDNAGKFDELLAEVNRRSQGPHPELSLSVQTTLQSQLRTLKAAALNPREIDDAPSYNRAITLIDSAENEPQYEMARAYVEQHAGMLKPETRKGLLSTIYERKTAGNVFSQPGVREGIRILTGTEVSQSAFNTMMRGNLNEAQSAHLNQALQVFRDWVQQTGEGPQGSRTQVNQEGPAKAQEIYDKYIEIPTKAARAQRMPVPLLMADGKTPIPDRTRVVQILDDPTKVSGVSDAQRKRMLDNWDEWARLEKAKKEEAAPPPVDKRSWWQRLTSPEQMAPGTGAAPAAPQATGREKVYD